MGWFELICVIIVIPLESYTTTKACRCRKFVDGLRFKVQREIVPMAIREFPTLVKKVKIVEHLECSNWVVKTRGDGSSGSKKGNHQKKPYSRPQQHHGGSTVPQVGKQGEVLRLWWTTLCLSMYSKGGQSAKSSNTLPSFYEDYTFWGCS